MAKTSNKNPTSDDRAPREPWPMSFVENKGAWTISSNDDRDNVPIAKIWCQPDGHNGYRRFAAHLVANA